MSLERRAKRDMRRERKRLYKKGVERVAWSRLLGFTSVVTNIIRGPRYNFYNNQYLLDALGTDEVTLKRMFLATKPIKHIKSLDHKKICESEDLSLRFLKCY